MVEEAVCKNCGHPVVREGKWWAHYNKARNMVLNRCMIGHCTCLDPQVNEMNPEQKIEAKNAS